MTDLLQISLARRLLRHGFVRDPRSICFILVAFAGCAMGAPDEIAPYYESSKADGIPFRLKKIDRHRVDIDEPSDLVFADGKLYTVSDRHSKIYQISRKGNVKAEIDIEGNDLEAIAVDPIGGDFAIGDESDDKVWFVDAAGERTAYIEIDGIADGNSGIEGLAFDDRGHLFVAKEKAPARIYELDERGFEIARTDIDFAADLSALAWNAEDGHLYALSDVDHSLYQLDQHMEAMAAWRLPVEHPEGIAFEGATLYVISDGEERIYEFAIVDD